MRRESLQTKVSSRNNADPSSSFLLLASCFLLLVVDDKIKLEIVKAKFFLSDPMVFVHLSLNISVCLNYERIRTKARKFSNC